MECWSIESTRLAELNLFLYEWYKAENKNRPSSAFDRQFSITPPRHYSVGFQTAKATPLSEPEAGVKSKPIQGRRIKAMDAHFYFGLALILFVFFLCFRFRKENRKK